LALAPLNRHWTAEGAEEARDPEHELERRNHDDPALHDEPDATFSRRAKVAVDEDRRERLRSEDPDEERERRSERIEAQQAVEIAMEQSKDGSRRATSRTRVVEDAREGARDRLGVKQSAKEPERGGCQGSPARTHRQRHDRSR
jgi:hypothetical protein